LKTQDPLRLYFGGIHLVKSRKNGNGKNGNGNSNGNGHYFFKIGTCPRCKKENVNLTEHHLYKRAVFGDSPIVILACRECHDDVEAIIREMENAILRAFIYCYRKVNKGFFSGKEFSREEIMQIVSQGFVKVNGNNTNPWLEERIRTKGITIGRRGSKKEQN
jgi:transcription elongation factor Elf1